MTSPWGNEVPFACIPATPFQHNNFLQVMDGYSLTQHVKVPTRPISGNILDLLLSTYLIPRVSTSSGLSDHDIVTFDFNLKPPQTHKPPLNIHAYKQANFADLI